MKNRLAILLVLMLSVVVMASSAFAATAPDVPVSVQDLEIEGSTYDASSIVPLDRGDKLDVSFDIKTGDFDLTDTEIEVKVATYGHSDKEELTKSIGPVNMRGNRTYPQHVTMELPERMKSKIYVLSIIVYNSDYSTTVFDYKFEVEDKESQVVIRDVTFSPENGVKSGRALLATVRIKNYGQNTEDSVKVSIVVPALGISASDYIDDIDSGDTESSEELFLRIPETAQPGNYPAVVEAVYNDGDDKTTMNSEITVLQDVSVPAASQDASVVSGETNPQTVKVGSIASYPITIANNGVTAKTYAITVSPVDWATFQINPSNLVVVDGGQTKILYLYVTPKTGSEGDRAFVVNVRSGDSLKQVALQASVVSAGTDAQPSTSEGWAGLKKSLQIGLIVLVVLLFILGLIVVFNKLTGPKDEDEEEEDEDEETKTYY
jgi:hypothetical protein